MLIPRQTILVVGGTGVFGSRLIERLALSVDCIVLIAGRSQHKAELLVESLSKRQPIAMLRAWVLDRERVTPEQLRAACVSIVIDAAGPFQGQAPRLAEIAIKAGCHFIDLADARDYVAAFPQLNTAALRANVLALCGASSTPSLSHAALDHLTGQWGDPHRVIIAISPGNRAPRGLSVVQAILSYVGQPIELRENARQVHRPGWSLLHRRMLKGLPPRWFSLCETPDLDLVPARFPTVSTAHFYAGLELAVLHCGLWMLSLLVRVRLLRTLAPFASTLHAIARRFEHFGSDRGGMLVQTYCWTPDGACIEARWGLLAEEGHGPYIPVLPAVAMIRRLLSGQESRRGAMACAGLLDLNDILGEFAGLRITAYEENARTESLFKRTLGSTFHRMPVAVRKLHTPRGTAVFRGRAQVDGSSHRTAALVARLFRFPKAMQDVPVEVIIEPQDNGEAWRRRFGDSGFTSVLGATETHQRLTERFGLVCFTLRIDADEHGLEMTVERASLGPVSLPRFLVPWTRACERVDAQGRFTFDVEIGFRGLGRLVRYRGWLTEDSRPQ